MPNFADYIFNRALNIGLASVYVGIVNNSTATAYKAGPTGSDGLFTFTGVPAGLYTVYTSATGSGLPPGGDWSATGEANYVVTPAPPIANTDLAGPLLNAITAGSNLSVGSAPGGVGAQSVALISNPTLAGLLTANAGLSLTGLLTMLDAASRVIPGTTSLSLRNHANNADNLILTDAGNATVRGTLLATGAVTANAGVLINSTNAGAGTLGYAQVTATQGTFTGQTDLTSLAVTVTVSAGRRIRISAFAGFGSSVSNDQAVMQIFEGATQLSQQALSLAAANQVQWATPVAILTPTAASHTYKLGAVRLSGTGNITMYAATSYPAFILVEDIGT